MQAKVFHQVLADGTGTVGAIAILDASKPSTGYVDIVDITPTTDITWESGKVSWLDHNKDAVIVALFHRETPYTAWGEVKWANEEIKAELQPKLDWLLAHG